MWTLLTKDRFCNVTQHPSVKERTPRLQHRQLPQVNNFRLKIASIQTASWSDSHERGSETKAPHNHHLFLLLARSSMLVLLLKRQPPLKQLPRGVPSCPDRGIFSSLCPRISMSHLSIVPFILPQQGIGPARALIQLFNVLMTLGRPETEGTNWTALVVKIHVSW